MQLVTHKFSVEQYHRMGETGILPPDKRFELIQGDIIPMSPVGFKHAATVRRITALCYRRFEAVISVQDPIRLNNESEPEPDIALLKPNSDFEDFRLPEANDVLLLIEVSDSTLRYDQKMKLPLYAANNILEVWIVNLREKQLEIHREPTTSGYQQQLIIKGAETITPIAFPAMAIAVSELLG